MVSDVEYLFIHVFAICVCFIGEMSIQDFNPLFKSGFLHYGVVGVLYLYGFNPLSDIWFATIFPHSVGCLFILLIVFVLYFAKASKFVLIPRNDLKL